jgi:hypothetical protein
MLESVGHCGKMGRFVRFSRVSVSPGACIHFVYAEVVFRSMFELVQKSRIRGVESYVSVNAGGIADGWLDGSKVSKAMRTMCCLQEEEGTWENSSARLAFNGCRVEPLDGEFVNSTKTWWHKKERDMP